MSAAALPPLQAITAPAGWQCIDFISDLHLDAAHPCTFKAWANFLVTTPAQAVFILGDLFEAWIGDDAVQQNGFEADAAKILRDATQRRWIGFLPGNRDFLVGAALLQCTGVHPLGDPTVLEAYGQRVLLTHGDMLCVDDVGYQRFRMQVRDPLWQGSFLARPLPERRAIAQAMRDASRHYQSNTTSWMDIDPTCALAWLTGARCSVLVHGHTHRPRSERLSGGFERHVLMDWELDELGPFRAQVLRLSQQGFTRVDL